MEPWIIAAAEELFQKGDDLDQAAYEVGVRARSMEACDQEKQRLMMEIIQRHHEEHLEGQRTGCVCQCHDLATQQQASAILGGGMTCMKCGKKLAKAEPMAFLGPTGPVRID